MKLKTIGVLITCHNRKNKTLSCFENLFIQQGVNDLFAIKVFLVDDGSTDGTSEAISKEFPQVNIIKGSGNLYWNRGMHLAWSVAAKSDFDFYLWLNDDTMLYDNCLKDLFESALEKNSESIICGSTCSSITGIITYGGRNIQGAIIKPNGLLQLCHHFNGNCVLIPKSVYYKIGNLDHKFNHSIGDFDYGRRATKLGVLSFVAPAFVGTCERHDGLQKWCSPSVKLKDRIKAFKSPLSVSPKQNFIYDRRHHGMLTALLHFVTIHVRLFFPGMWVRNKKV